jgi:hypothetical protein
MLKAFLVKSDLIFESNSQTVQHENISVKKEQQNVSFIPMNVHSQKIFHSIQKCFKENEKEINIELDVHADGSSLLSKNILLYNFSFFIDSRYLKQGKDVQTKPKPYMAVIGKEDISSSKYYNSLSGILIGDAISKPFHVGDKIIHLKLRFINGDNKAIWSVLGNKHGGHGRCWGCRAPFDKKNIKKNLFYHEFSKFMKKGPKENFLLFLKSFKEKLKPEELKKQVHMNGLISSPYFLESLYYSYHKEGKQENEFLTDLSNILVGVDNLHNIRGWILNLISTLKHSGRLNEAKFASLLKTIGLTPSDCSGNKLRLLLLNFESVLLPALIYDKSHQQPITESLTKVLKIFQIITWAAYSPQEAQQYPGIKLLLRYKCFELSVALQALPPDLKLIDLYLHVILSHFPDFFDKYSFHRTSTEPLELLFVTVKRCKYSVRRQNLNILKNILKRFENKDQRDHIFLGSSQSYLDSISRKDVKDNPKFISSGRSCNSFRMWSSRSQMTKQLLNLNHSNPSLTMF